MDFRGVLVGPTKQSTDDRIFDLGGNLIAGARPCFCSDYARSMPSGWENMAMAGSSQAKDQPLSDYGEYVARYLGNDAFQFGLALVVVTIAMAAWIASRRRYVRSADFIRSIEVLKFEFRRSLEDVRVATARKATGITDNLLSVGKRMDSNVTDLHVRLARLEEYADTIEAFIAGPQKQILQQNDQIDARLRTLEQRLTALTSQLSVVEQTLDGAGLRDHERNKSIEDINVRLVNAQKQVDELFPRLELGEKARADLGGVISLFVKQLKRVTLDSSETAVRVAELENLRTKITGLEQRLSPAVDRDAEPSTGDSVRNNNGCTGDAAAKAADYDIAQTSHSADSDVNQTNHSAENSGTIDHPTPIEEATEEASVQIYSEHDEPTTIRHDEAPVT